MVLNSYSQSSINDSNHIGLKKNSVYGSVGLSALYRLASINYERIIIQRNTGLFKNYLVRGSVGYWTAGPFAVVGVGTLTGLRNNHLETNVGFAYIFDKQGYDIGIGNSGWYDGIYYPEPDKSEYTDYKLSGAIGYRYQKPDGNFIFRTGIAYPERVYLSCGLSF